MSNAVFGFQNRVTTGSLIATGYTAGLDVTQLQNDQGSPATALQIPSTTGALLINAGSAVAWRAFALARTNLTTAATIRWVVGPPEAFLEEPVGHTVSFANPTSAGITAAGWTFARASGASQISDDGQTMAQVATNAPRGNSSGVLIESGTVNQMPNNVATTGWGTTETAITTSTAVPALYPGASRYLSTKSGSSGDNAFFFTSVAGLTVGQPCTVSAYVWIPISSPCTAFSFSVDDGTTAQTLVASVTGDVTKTGAWQRVWASIAAVPANGTVRSILRFTGMSTGSAAYATCYQVELNARPTSYIHTAGATAPRATDSLLRVGDTATICASGSYTLSVQAVIPVAPATGYVDTSLVRAGAALTAVLRWSGTVQALPFNSAGAQIASALASVYGGATNITARAVMAVSPGTLALRASVGTASVQSYTGLSSASLPDALQFSAAAEASVYVKTLTFYPKRISDAQMNALATTGLTVTNAYVYNSGFMSAGVAAGFGQTVTVAPADATGQMCQVDITDPTNPDGFLNLPLVYAGPAWIPQTNISYDTTFGRDDQTDETTSRGGAEFPSVQYTRRRWDISMQGIRSTETWPQAMELDRVARTGTNVLFVPNPASADVQREAVFGRLKALADLSFPFGNADRRAWRARITERL